MATPWETMKQYTMAAPWENKQNGGLRHKVLKVGESSFLAKQSNALQPNILKTAYIKRIQTRSVFPSTINHGRTWLKSRSA
jgi:hypothetical protein